jgi:hypothetical protein
MPAPKEKPHRGKGMGPLGGAASQPDGLGHRAIAILVDARSLRLIEC